jgi:predicted phosphoribosyltransferase
LSFDLPFPNRVAAGRALGHRLHDLKAQQPVVLALPNGGVVVAAEVARSLTSPLDVIGVRKLRTPGEPELALGAVAEDEVQVLNQVLVEEAGLSTDDLAQLTAAARAALGEQLGRYRTVPYGACGSPQPEESTALRVVDPAVARITGPTGMAAMVPCPVGRAALRELDRPVHSERGGVAPVSARR